MGNNSVPKFIFRLYRFPVYRGSILGRFYCTMPQSGWRNWGKLWETSIKLVGIRAENYGSISAYARERERGGGGGGGGRKNLSQCSSARVATVTNKDISFVLKWKGLKMK